jgi:hypothetical protein
MMLSEKCKLATLTGIICYTTHRPASGLVLLSDLIMRFFGKLHFPVTVPFVFYNVNNTHRNKIASKQYKQKRF